MKYIKFCFQTIFTVDGHGPAFVGAVAPVAPVAPVVPVFAGGRDYDYDYDGFGFGYNRGVGDSGLPKCAYINTDFDGDDVGDGRGLVAESPHDCKRVSEKQSITGKLDLSKLFFLSKGLHRRIPLPLLDLPQGVEEKLLSKARRRKR